MLIAGISPPEFASQMHVSRKTVHDWLKMPTAKPSGEHCAHMGMVLGVSIRWLTLGIGTPEPIGIKEARVARLTV